MTTGKRTSKVGTDRGRKLQLAIFMVVAALMMAGCSGTEGGEGGDGGDQNTDTGSPTEPQDNTDASGDPIVVGAALDITGAGAQLAEQQVNALELLTARINDEGGVDGRPIELEIVDNQSEEARAAQNMTRLVNEGAHVVIGASLTGPSMAMRQIAIDNEVPMISLAAGDAIVQDAPTVFKTTKGSSTIVQKLVNYFETQGYETIGLLRDASGFGEGVDGLFRDAGAEAGMEVVFDDRFDSAETDFDPLLVRMRDAGADVNVVWGIGSPPFLITNAYRDLGIEAALALPTTNPVFLTEAGDNANGVVFAGEKMFVWDELPEDDPQYDTIQGFVSEYENEYGEVPDHFAGAAHDAFMQAIEAFRSVGTEPAAVAGHLEGLTDWVGINGVYSRSADDHVGLDTDDLVIVEIGPGEDPFERWALAEDQPE